MIFKARHTKKMGGISCSKKRQNFFFFSPFSHSPSLNVSWCFVFAIEYHAPAGTGYSEGEYKPS